MGEFNVYLQSDQKLENVVTITADSFELALVAARRFAGGSAALVVTATEVQTRNWVEKRAVIVAPFGSAEVHREHMAAGIRADMKRLRHSRNVEEYSAEDIEGAEVAW